MAKAKNVDRFTPALVVVSVALAFAVGVLWQKVSVLEGGGSRTAGTQVGDTSAAQQPTAQGPEQGKMSEDEASKIVPVSEEDHVRGNRNAKVFLVEYSDYECPFCARFHPTAQQIMDEYGDEVAWVYRHFPLDQIHPKARPAANASECIAELGGEEAFWEFTDNVFGDQTKLNDLAAAAAEVGVNQTAFQNCVDSEKFADVVEQNYQDGLKAGVRGTPGNFILTADGDAWFLPGAYPFDQFKVSIDEALQS